MKLVEDRQDVLVGGAQSVDAFTIKASAKAFQILSQNLYSNPCGSMIRELSTNAYDAHVMVGKKDEPFILTLPNSLEPTFKIRDFGPGMSHQDIMSVYTTFFESTKTNSNDVVGCLGLGSKSPFGVADSFTVTTYYNGTKTIYSSFLNDARIPSIAKFGEFPTDEENGLEIEVAIKEDNFSTFSKEVNSQLKYFKVKPIIRGNSDFKWDTEEEYMYEGTGWKMVRGGGSPRVIQGQIQYPISPKDMGKVFESASAGVKELLCRPVLFEVDIGQVNIAPSREALSYDERTCKNIVSVAEKIIAELPSKLIACIENCETEYEAKIKYNELIGDLSRVYSSGYNRSSYYSPSKGSLADALAESGTILWHGKDVSNCLIELDETDINSATRFTLNYRTRFQKNNYTTYSRTAGGRKWEFHTESLDNTIWIYSTVGDKVVEARAKQYMLTKGRNVTMYIINTNLGLKDIAAKFGLGEKHFVMASNLPKIARAKPTPSTGKKLISVSTFNKSNAYNKSGNWDKTEVEDLNTLEGFYVEVHRFDTLDNKGQVITQFKAYVNGAIELGLIKTTDEIYGLNASVKGKKHKLVNLLTHIKEEAKKIKLHTKYEWEYRGAIDRLMAQHIDATKILGSISPDSPVVEIVQAIIDSRATDYSGDAKHLINGLKLNPKVISMSHHNAVIDKLYPMMACMNRYSYDTNDTDHIIEYINCMDTLRTIKAKNTQ